MIYSTFAGATRSTCEEGREGGWSLFIISFPNLIPSSWDLSMCVCVCLCRLELNNEFVVVKLGVEAGGATKDG